MTENLILIGLTAVLMHWLNTKSGQVILIKVFDLSKTLIIAVIIVAVVKGDVFDAFMTKLESQPINVNVSVSNSNTSWQNVRSNVARWQPQIERAATQCNVDAALLTALITQESGGDPSICSSAGACGLTQLMPGTAQEMNVTDRFDPTQSTVGGACYLRKLLTRYNNDEALALAAYNAGAGNVDTYGGIPPFKETQQYVVKVQSYKQQIQASQNKIAQVPSGECCLWPLPVRGTITTQPSPTHMALDIAAPIGTPLLASHGGKVIWAKWSEVGYGKLVIIDHGKGLQTYYAHLSSYTVEAGDHVEGGDIIGRVGSTGNSTGPHLHYEVRKNNSLKNPWDYTTQPE